MGTRSAGDGERVHVACAHAFELHLDNYVPEKKEKADGRGRTDGKEKMGARERRIAARRRTTAAGREERERERHAEGTTDRDQVANFLY